jgi:hypothetical protein
MQVPPDAAPPRRGRGRPPGSTVKKDAAAPNPTINDLANAAASVTQEPASPPPAKVARPSLRPDLRAEDPRAAAEARAKEILEHLDGMDEGTDEFYISADMIPDGWTYEWKRRLILGKPDPAYDVSLRRTGWQDVPASRHPEMMPLGIAGNASIERKGMVLMERPQQITDRIVQRDKKLARDQVRVKEEQLSQAAPGQFSRTEDPRTKPKVNRSYEPMAIPADK